MENNEFIPYPHMQVPREFLLRLKKLALNGKLEELSNYVLCNVIQSMADNILYLRAENERLRDGK